MVAWLTKVVALGAAIGAVNAQLGPKPPASALLTAENAGAEKFGDVVAAKDDTVLASFQDGAGEFRVQTYKRGTTEGTWEQTGVVGPFNSEITAMAFSGDKVYVGTPDENAVHVLTKATDGESWTKAAVTLTQPYTTKFGLSLAGDSTQLLVGSQFDTFLYTSDGTGNLNAVRLTAGLADRRGKVIGQDVALSGGKYLVGAPSESLTSKGAVYVYNGAGDEDPVVLSSPQELSNEFGARVDFYDAAAYVSDTARELVYAFDVSADERIISESNAEAFATAGDFVVSVYNGVLTIKDTRSTLEEISLSSTLGDSDILDIAVDAEFQVVVLGFDSESAPSIFALQFFYPITAAPVPPTPAPTQPPTKSARENADQVNLINLVYGVVGMVGGCLIWTAVVIKRAMDDKKKVNKLKKELEEEAQDRVVIVSGPFSDEKDMDAENGVATKL